MTSSFKDHVIHENNLFYIDLGSGERACLEYSMRENVMAIESTYTPKKFRGIGLAAAMTETALQYAKENKLKIRPICGYAVRFLEQHPEYKNLLE